MLYSYNHSQFRIISGFMPRVPIWSIHHKTSILLVGQNSTPPVPLDVELMHPAENVINSAMARDDNGLF